MRALKVAIVSPTFGGYGGLEAFVLALAAGLPATPELEVHVVFKRVAGFDLRPELAAAIAPLGARVSFVDSASAGLVRAILGADLVHVQNPCPDVVALARLGGRRLLVNVINHRLPGESWRQRLWDLALRWAHRRFYISEFVRGTWEGPVAWPRSEVVFPICELPQGAKPVAARRGFVFAARWIANKGVETLVNAYASAGLDPALWPLRMIGDGPLRAPILETIRARGVRGIEAPGFLSAAEKQEAIRSARFMVVPPQTREDFGLTAIEARAVGVPCIVTRDGGVPEAAGAEALVCEPGDAAGLADCLRRAAAMSDDEYAGRAERTHAELQTQLVRPADYARFYRELMRR